MANAAIDTLSAFLLEADFVVKAAVAGNPGVFTLPGNYDGIVVQSIIGSDSSNQSEVYIGFNKNQPALFVTSDPFKPAHKWVTCEVYNYSNIDYTCVVVLFNGVYYPAGKL